MFLPHPQTLVLMMSVGAFLILAERLSRPDLWTKIDNRFSEAIQRLGGITSKVVSFWLAGLCSFGAYLVFGPIVENQLWASGNFGEPPWNRTVHVSWVDDSGGSTIWVEFRASQVPVDGWNFLISVMPEIVEEGSSRWLSCAPMLEDEPSGSLGCTGVQGIFSGGYNGPKFIGTRSDNGSTTPERSTYAVFRVKKPNHNMAIECYFRSKLESEGFYCGRDVEILFNGDV